MTGWVVVWVLGVCAVLAVAANHHYCWTRGWLYSWRRAQHVIEEAKTIAAAPEYGSMIFDEEIRAVNRYGYVRGVYDVDPDPWLTRRVPDWRQQTLAELSPEALNGKLEAQRALWASERKPMLLLPMGDPSPGAPPPGEDGAAVAPPSITAPPGAGDESEPSGAPAHPAPGLGPRALAVLERYEARRRERWALA